VLFVALLSLFPCEKKKKIDAKRRQFALSPSQTSRPRCGLGDGNGRAQEIMYIYSVTNKK
jgi:hypothetical protein